MTRTILIFLTALMPVAIMGSQAVPSPLFYAAVLAALWLLARQRFAGAMAFSRAHGGMLLCMAAPLLAVLSSGLGHGRIEGVDLEASLRFFLGFWVLLLAYGRLDAQALQKSLWGFVLAAVAATGFVFYLALQTPDRPQTTAVYNAVGYGSLLALLAMLCVLLVPVRLTAWRRAETGLKLAVAGLSLAGVALTLTRTAWMAMPVFVVIAAVLFAPPKRPLRLLGIVLAGLLLVGVFLGASDSLRGRVVLAYQEAADCAGAQRTTDSSICIRLQLWRASLDMLDKRPLAGTGSKRHFNDYLQSESLPAGTVSSYVAEGWGEPHNDLMLYLASFGYPGGLALLLVYLGPAYCFGRRLLGDPPVAQRAAAAMGLAVCLGFMVFGLTETMFRGMRTVSFYAMCMALFAGLSMSSEPAGKP
ncbi:O-antigen ligase family protein [Castellaniella hirudinis]|uniref:O-antigen ligase family protein n=1 Tax=Castellaniella hirudinis TaxID=1144617 RepID=UPI0039C293DE